MQHPMPFKIKPLASKSMAGACAMLAIGLITEAGKVPWMLALAAGALVLAAASFIMGRATVPILGLTFTVPFDLMHHLTYIPGQIGSSSGLTVDLTDLWVIWLVLEYGYARWKRNVRPAPGLAGIFLPMALLLVADVFSLWGSSDIVLTLYGIVAHVKLAALFLILALTIAQGESQLRAASLGFILAVLVVGAVCIVESVLSVNFRASLEDDGMADYAFRAAGLNTATLTAGYLAVLLPIICIDLITCRGFRKCLAALALCLGLAGLFCTLTRAAFVLLIIGSIPLLVYLHRRRFIRPRHILVCVGAAAIVYASLADRIHSRLDEGNGNLIGRNVLIKAAFNMAATSPIVGVGLNTYEVHMFEFMPRDENQRWVAGVHNEFARALAETGPLGLFALVWLIGLTVVRATSLARISLPMGIGLLCSMIIAALDMNIESYASGPDRVNLWIVLAIVAGLFASKRSAHISANRQLYWPDPA
jgi:hypothetical protein